MYWHRRFCILQSLLVSSNICFSNENLVFVIKWHPYFLPNCTAFLSFLSCSWDPLICCALSKAPSFPNFHHLFLSIFFYCSGRDLPIFVCIFQRNLWTLFIVATVFKISFLPFYLYLISSFCGFKLFLFPSFLRWKFIANSFYKSLRSSFVLTQYVFQLLLWTVTLWDSLRGEAV